MNEIDAAEIRAVLNQRPPRYCPEARKLGLELAFNADFGQTHKTLDDLKRDFDEFHIYPGARRNLPSNGEQQLFMPMDAGHHRIDLPYESAQGSGHLALIAQPTIGDNSGDACFIGSAMVMPKRTFNRGFFETTFIVSGGPAVWPAFWMYPANGAVFPEVDWFEGLWNVDPNRENPTGLHLAVHPAENQTEQVEFSLCNQWSDYYGPGVNWTQTPVTVAGFWWDDHVTHYVNGVKARSGKLAWLDSHGNDAGDVRLLFDLCIGGNWPGRAMRKTFTVPPVQAVARVDYIRFWGP